jgi:hypothetical protein
MHLAELSISAWKLAPVADAYFTARGAAQPQLRIEIGSFGPNPVQEEVNGSLSMPLLGFWIRCDAVE